MPYQNSRQRSWWELKEMAYPRDLIIIGSGITGLSAAIFYKRKHPNATVLVLDRGFWPNGATARNAGFACFGSAGELVDDLQYETEDEVKERLKLRFRGLELLKKELGENAISYSQCGGYEIFDDEAHFHESREHLPLFNSWVQEISGVKDSYQSLKYNKFDAVYNGLEGYLNSGKLLVSLKKKAESAGVEFRWNSPVQSVDEHSVTLEDGLELNAGSVLVAVNGFASRLIPDCGVEPARGYVFVTKPLPEINWKGTFHYNRGYVYFRDLDENRLLIGGGRHVDKNGERSFENAINPMVKQWLIHFTNVKILPDTNWEIDHEWTGIMGFAQSKTPVCEKTESGVYCAAGLGGMGVAIGMEVGRKIAGIIGDAG